MDQVQVIGEVVKLAFWAVGIIAAAAIAWERIKVNGSSNRERIERLDRDVQSQWVAIGDLRTKIAELQAGVAVLLERTRHLDGR
jgi:N-methylhydantoinase B/oxoprolinase/acetone carboxylase alpha subunit